MKQAYYLYIRDKNNGVWWFRDSHNPRNKGTLGTMDKGEARKKAEAIFEKPKDVEFHTSMAQIHLRQIDPTKATRTWDMVFDTKIASVKGSTQKRWECHKKSKAFNSIRNMVLTQTQADDLRRILFAQGAKVSTRKCLMELHKFALDNGYLIAPVLPKAQWPEIKHGKTRAITKAEHEKILAREPNEERKAYYKMLWLVGGSQSDIAELKADSVNWKDETLSYRRKKCGSLATLKMGTQLKNLLKTLPQSGNLFPYLRSVRECDRATEFRQRCESVGIMDKALKLHSYRYAIIENMREEGYPERDAMNFAGHQSRIVHQVYAKNASVNIPSLEAFKESKNEVQLLRAKLAALEQQQQLKEAV